MCCSFKTKESCVTTLILLAVIFSLGVSVPMLLITYPGDECLLFVSVRGEALIYGHPAGCNYVTGAHFVVVLGSIFFCVLFLLSRRHQNSFKPEFSISNRSLRGSMSGFSQHNAGRQKVTLTLVVMCFLLTTVVILTAIIVLSGYIKTCGELQYETRRQLYGRTTLGNIVKDVYITCFSLYRDSDFHARFHFDHYELSGQWHGQYTAYKHGRPNTWSGTHIHHIPIPTGLEMSLICSWISCGVWIAISLLILLLRQSVKSLQRKDTAESLEDARIWAADSASISPIGLTEYEMSSLKKVKIAHPQISVDKHQYEQLEKHKEYNNSIKSQHQLLSEMVTTIPQQSDTQILLKHQEVVAQTHPDGTFFLTPEGSYVQLVNGVLTNVDVQSLMQEHVLYTELDFQTDLK